MTKILIDAVTRNSRQSNYLKWDKKLEASHWHGTRIACLSYCKISNEVFGISFIMAYFLRYYSFLVFFFLLFSFPNPSDRLWDPSIHLFNRSSFYLLAVKQPERQTIHSHHVSAEVIANSPCMPWWYRHFQNRGWTVNKMANATENLSEIESHENENEYVNLRARDSELDFPTEQRNLGPMTVLPHFHLSCSEGIKEEFSLPSNNVCYVRE